MLTFTTCLYLSFSNTLYSPYTTIMLQSSDGQNCQRRGGHSSNNHQSPHQGATNACNELLALPYLAVTTPHLCSRQDKIQRLDRTRSIFWWIIKLHHSMVPSGGSYYSITAWYQAVPPKAIRRISQQTSITSICKSMSSLRS